MNRYFAIKYPLRRTSFFGSYSNLILIIIWIFGIAISLPQFVASRIETFKYGDNTYLDCREDWDDKHNEKIFLLIIFLATFAFPTLILIFTYGSIGIALKRHITPGNANNARDKAILNAKVRAVKMMIAIVVMFILCWLPIQTFNLIIYNEWYLDIMEFKTFQNIYVSVFFGCHFLAMAHSMANPFIYCFMSDNFMSDLKRAINDSCHSMTDKLGKFQTSLQSTAGKRRTTADVPETVNMDIL